VLTSLEPPSPASPGGPREVEHSLQTTPQLPSPLRMISPPEPEKHRDTGESSKVTPIFKRWLQTRFKKTNKNHASQLREQLSTESGQPVNLRFDYQSQPTANIPIKAPSRMAAAQRVRVSVFFFGRQQVCGMSDQASQRSIAKPVIWVRCSVCSLAPLFILRRSVKERPNLQIPSKSGKTTPVADKSPQVQRKWTLCVCFY
jgi:hypothetical protein